MMNVTILATLLLSVQSATIDLQGVQPGEMDVPVVIQSLPEKLIGNGSVYKIHQSGKPSSNVMLLQILPERKTGVFIVPKEQTGTDLHLQVESSSVNTPDRFSFNADDKSLHLFESVDGDSRPVWSYNFGIMSKEGVPADRNRSSYFHPVYGLEGEIVTDDFPADHYHHRGIYWAWPHVEINGRSYDIWHLRGIGFKHEEFLYRETGPVCAALGIRNGWYLADGKKVVDERVDVIVYPSDGTGQAMDFRLEWRAVDDEVKIVGQSDQAKGYGGFLFRAAPRRQTTITTLAGRQRADSDRVANPWADMSAFFNGHENFTGISIFSNAENEGHPPGWTLRHYGYMGVAYPGLRTLVFTKDESIVLNYRVWLHRHGAEEGKVREAHTIYTHPYESINVALETTVTDWGSAY